MEGGHGVRKKADCVACGKRGLTRDEVGICQKLLGKGIKSFYCYDCLADFLDCTVEDILAKIEEFKAGGCTLFG